MKKVRTMSEKYDYSKRELDLTQKPRKWVISNRDYSFDDGKVRTFFSFHESRKHNWKHTITTAAMTGGVVGVSFTGIWWLILISSLLLTAVVVLGVIGYVRTPPQYKLWSDSAIGTDIKNGKRSLLVDSAVEEIKKRHESDSNYSIWLIGIWEKLFSLWEDSEILDENLEKEIKKAVLTLSKSPQSKSAASEFLKRIDILKETVDVAVENKKKMLEIEESENKASFLSDMDSLIERV